MLAQQPKNFLQRVYATTDSAVEPMLGPGAPAFTLNIAAQELAVERGASALTLSVPGSPVRLQARRERRDGIDLYRIRHAPGSPMQGEQIRLNWVFPDEFNESMTLDAGALQGQPLFLPDGKVPDNQFTNWGSLFYDRTANLAVGAALDGAVGSRHARRGHSRFTRTSTLQLMATTGNPAMELIFFAYRPRDSRFWWAEWYQLRLGADKDLPPNLFPILSPRDLGWRPGERQTIDVIPAPADRGRKMELVLIDEIRQSLAARVPFEMALPVTHVETAVGEWRSGLYRAVVVPAGAAVDPGRIDLNGKLTNVIVRPASPRGRVLFGAPTDMWWAYSTNGGHDFHGWRTGYDGSVGYSPTVMSSRQRRFNHFFYSLYERYNDIHHLRYLDELARGEGIGIDYATQLDVARGRVRLDGYDLVLIGNHCEFTTEEAHRRFSEYMGRGGAVMLHGGDSFAVRVDYLPSLEEPRYIRQRGHIWAHLSDQPGEFRSPRIEPPDPGDARDYLNAFHTTVGYWIPGSKAVIANADHPVTRGLKPAQEVPGPWGGETDFVYEPAAWDILVRSDRTAPEQREFGVDAHDPTPLHRVGLAIHKNLRLAMVGGENFPNILKDPENALYRDLYRRTFQYLLDGGLRSKAADWRAAPLDRAGTIEAVRYRLPVAVDYANPEWHRRPAPYAHYVVEGSEDGRVWSMLADRRHGPWRDVQTDFVAPARVRYVRLVGETSSGVPLRAADVEVLVRGR